GQGAQEAEAPQPQPQAEVLPRYLTGDPAISAPAVRARPSAGGRRRSAEQLVEQDGAEGRGPYPAQREAAELDRQIAGTDDQRDADHDEVARIREVDPVLDPDPSAG